MSSSKIFKDDSSFIPVSLLSKTESESPPCTDSAEQESASPDTPPLPNQNENAAHTLKSSPEYAENTSPPPPSQDLELIKAEAYQQGKHDAEQGLMVNLGQTLEAFSQACSGIDTLHNSLLEQSRGEMINIIIALCKKIIGQELATGRDIIADTLQKALELAIRHNEYDVTVHPDDLSSAEKIIPELIHSIQKLEHITLKTDPQMTRGGCRLDSSVCMVDATIEAQLETTREFLEDKGPDCAPQPLEAVPQENEIKKQ